jgi:hypothetical protein
MPAVAYTIVLWELHNMGFPFPHLLPSPPVGFVWVVRDVTIRNATPAGWVPTYSQASLRVDGQALVATPAYRTVGFVLYETRDVRQTITSAQSVDFNALEAGWDLRVTGYQLTVGA